MRLSNKHKKGLYHFWGTVVLMVLLAGIVLFLIQRYHYGNVGFDSAWFLIIPFAVALVFYLRGRFIFEYDSDGEGLNFRNKNTIFFWQKELRDEFPKYKLQSYEIVNAIIFKNLYVKISSKKTNSIILKYDISYLTNKELSDLKFSLSKVVRTNTETTRENKS